MRKAKTILLRGIFYLLALQILNLSIDVDYAVYQGTSQNLAGYDDVDAFSELIVEKIMNNDKYTSEDDDDSGNAQDKGLEKYCSGPLYFESHTKVHLPACLFAGHSLGNNSGNNNKTSKGFYSVFSPPPDAAALA